MTRISRLFIVFTKPDVSFVTKTSVSFVLKSIVSFDDSYHLFLKHIHVHVPFLPHALPLPFSFHALGMEGGRPLKADSSFVDSYRPVGSFVQKPDGSIV